VTENNPFENDAPGFDSAEYLNSPRPFAAPADLSAQQADLNDQESEPIERESLTFGGILAWLVIAVVVTGMIALTAMSRSHDEASTEATSSDLFPVQLQARTLVGQKGFLSRSTKTNDDDNGDGEKEEQKDDTESDNEDATEAKKEKTKPSGPPVPETLNEGTYEQRLCYVLLIRENNGPDEAAKKLTELDEAAAKADFVLNEDQAKLREITGKLIESHQAGDPDVESLSEEDPPRTNGWSRHGCGLLNSFRNEKAWTKIRDPRQVAEYLHRNVCVVDRVLFRRTTAYGTGGKQCGHRPEPYRRHGNFDGLLFWIADRIDLSSDARNLFQTSLR